MSTYTDFGLCQLNLLFRNELTQGWDVCTHGSGKICNKHNSTKIDITVLRTLLPLFCL